MNNARDLMGGQGRVLVTVNRVAPSAAPGFDLPS